MIRYLAKLLAVLVALKWLWTLAPLWLPALGVAMFWVVVIGAVMVVEAWGRW